MISCQAGRPQPECKGDLQATVRSEKKASCHLLAEIEANFSHLSHLPAPRADVHSEPLDILHFTMPIPTLDDDDDAKLRIEDIYGDLPPSFILMVVPSARIIPVLDFVAML